MRRYLLPFACLLMIAGGALTAHLNWDGADRPTPQVVIDLPPCAEEDSPGPCYWDAPHRGNGQGTSFWVGGDGQVHYLP